jgi:hypothetical protein
MAAPTSAVKPAARYNFAYVPGDSRPIIFRLRTAVGPFNPDGDHMARRFSDKILLDSQRVDCGSCDRHSQVYAY